MNNVLFNLFFNLQNNNRYAIMKLFFVLTYFELNNYIIPSDDLTSQKK